MCSTPYPSIDVRPTYIGVVRAGCDAPVTILVTSGVLAAVADSHLLGTKLDLG